MRVELALDEPGWFRVGVPGDGNCAFYSIGCCLNYLDYRNSDLVTQVRIGKSLRRRLLGRERSKDYDAFIEDRGFEGLCPSLASLAPPAVYAGDFIISFVAHLLGPDLRIVVLVGPGEYLNFGSGDYCVVLCHIDNHDHFEAVCREAPLPTDLAPAIQDVARSVAEHGIGRSRLNAVRIGEHAVSPDDGLRGIFHVRELPKKIRDAVVAE